MGWIHHVLMSILNIFKSMALSLIKAQNGRIRIDKILNLKIVFQWTYYDYININLIHNERIQNSKIIQTFDVMFFQGGLISLSKSASASGRPVEILTCLFSSKFPALIHLAFFLEQS